MVFGRLIEDNLDLEGAPEGPRKGSNSLEFDEKVEKIVCEERLFGVGFKSDLVDFRALVHDRGLFDRFQAHVCDFGALEPKIGFFWISSNCEILEVRIVDKRVEGGCCDADEGSGMGLCVQECWICLKEVKNKVMKIGEEMVDINDIWLTGVNICSKWRRDTHQKYKKWPEKVKNQQKLIFTPARKNPPKTQKIDYKWLFEGSRCHNDNLIELQFHKFSIFIPKKSLFAKTSPDQKNKISGFEVRLIHSKDLKLPQEASINPNSIIWTARSKYTTPAKKSRKPSSECENKSQARSKSYKKGIAGGFESSRQHKIYKIEKFRKSLELGSRAPKTPQNDRFVCIKQERDDLDRILVSVFSKIRKKILKFFCVNLGDFDHFEREKGDCYPARIQKVVVLPLEGAKNDQKVEIRVVMYLTKMRVEASPEKHLQHNGGHHLSNNVSHLVLELDLSTCQARKIFSLKNSKTKNLTLNVFNEARMAFLSSPDPKNSYIINLGAQKRDITNLGRGAEIISKCQILNGMRLRDHNCSNLNQNAFFFDKYRKFFTKISIQPKVKKLEVFLSKFSEIGGGRDQSVDGSRLDRGLSWKVSSEGLKFDVGDKWFLDKNEESGVVRSHFYDYKSRILCLVGSRRLIFFKKNLKKLNFFPITFIGLKPLSRMVDHHSGLQGPEKSPPMSQKSSEIDFFENLKVVNIQRKKSNRSLRILAETPSTFIMIVKPTHGAQISQKGQKVVISKVEKIGQTEAFLIPKSSQNDYLFITKGLIRVFRVNKTTQKLIFRQNINLSIPWSSWFTSTVKNIGERSTYVNPWNNRVYTRIRVRKKAKMLIYDLGLYKKSKKYSLIEVEELGLEGGEDEFGELKFFENLVFSLREGFGEYRDLGSSDGSLRCSLDASESSGSSGGSCSTQELPGDQKSRKKSKNNNLRKNEKSRELDVSGGKDYPSGGSSHSSTSLCNNKVENPLKVKKNFEILLFIRNAKFQVIRIVDLGINGHVNFWAPVNTRSVILSLSKPKSQNPKIHIFRQIQPKSHTIRAPS